ncbi:hypothetical protein DFH11DRAFT_1647601 [Phellopilus nigrolimitatus]|nr:hypothetical protein DFH11DRAFT_1647601 [Phellopilus nigrolimitatus]
MLPGSPVHLSHRLYIRRCMEPSDATKTSPGMLHFVGGGSFLTKFLTLPEYPDSGCRTQKISPDARAIFARRCSIDGHKLFLTAESSVPDEEDALSHTVWISWAKMCSNTLLVVPNSVMSNALSTVLDSARCLIKTSAHSVNQRKQESRSIKKTASLIGLHLNKVRQRNCNRGVHYPTLIVRDVPAKKPQPGAEERARRVVEYTRAAVSAVDSGYAELGHPAAAE